MFLICDRLVQQSVILNPGLIAVTANLEASNPEKRTFANISVSSGDRNHHPRAEESFCPFFPHTLVVVLGVR